MRVWAVALCATRVIVRAEGESKTLSFGSDYHSGPEARPYICHLDSRNPCQFKQRICQEIFDALRQYVRLNKTLQQDAVYESEGEKYVLLFQ